MDLAGYVVVLWKVGENDLLRSLGTKWETSGDTEKKANTKESLLSFLGLLHHTKTFLKSDENGEGLGPFIT